MEIKPRAPAVARVWTEIAASRESVWSLLSDIRSWPSWNPDVKSASIDGPLTEGTVSRWKAGPSTIRSTLQAVEPPALIGWTGRTLGIAATHVYRLAEHDGTTTVTSEESWEGALVRVFRKSMQKTLHQSLESGLRYLKAEAERYGIAFGDPAR